MVTFPSIELFILITFIDNSHSFHAFTPVIATNLTTPDRDFYTINREIRYSMRRYVYSNLYKFILGRATSVGIEPCIDD